MLIIMAIVGFVTGVLAKFVAPGRLPGNLFILLVLGIGGGVLAGSLAWYSGNALVAVFSSIGGAVLLLFLFRAFMGRDLGPLTT
jgi:uncharacterized membrane protein YeaQ/YmgE (transglycosylase-associated protein family)